MAKISPEKIVETATSYCQEVGLRIPKDFRADFLDNVVGVGSLDKLSIINIRQLTWKICKKIKAILDTDRKLAGKYGKLFDTVRAAVRWRIVLQLEEPGDILEEFLASLPKGKSWNIADLRHWKKNGENRGRKVFALARRERKTFTLREIEEMLGRRVKLLKRNPFEKGEWNERDRVWAKRVLLKFFATLSTGKKWNQNMLRRWKGDGTENGNNLCSWIHEQKMGFQYETVVQILGEDADKLLRRNPFDRRDEIIWNNERAGETLRWYFQALQSGEHWNSTDLRKWKEPGGIPVGQRLYAWIMSQRGAFNLKIVKEILGSDADRYLLRNPYEKEEQIDWTPLKAKRLLVEYLRTLPEGETWSRGTLYLWRKDGLNIGERLYKWIWEKWMAEETSGFTLEKIKNLLGGDAEALLARNPFEKQEQTEWNLAAARKILRRYLVSLQDGQSWNVARIQRWKENGVNSGPNFYAWISREKGEMNETVVRWILGKKADEFLEKNPFIHQERRRIIPSSIPQNG